MSRETREIKRMAGMLAARMLDLKLYQVEDRRRRQGRRWSLEVALRMVLVGMAAGRQSVAEIEELTERMSPSLRRKLGIGRRLPDTTLHDILVRLGVYDMRQCLRHLNVEAWRRKSLQLEGLPFHAVAMDGKGTAVPYWDHHYSQQKTYDDGRKAHGIVRTVTACLISTAAKPILDCFPIPAETSEMGIFPHAFESLVRNYGGLFQLVTYDAGVPSKDNCQCVVDAGKDFFFRVKNENWLIFKDLHRRLDRKSPDEAWAETEDVVGNNKSVLRRVFVAKAVDSSWGWASVQSLIRVNVQTVNKGRVTHEEDKYYLSSLPPERLSGKQWLRLSRGHWAVENNGHWTLDAIFREDERPWIKSFPRATVVLMVLRRIVYTLLALFRAVTLRSEQNRSMRWKRLIHWVLDTLIAVTEEQLEGLNFQKEAKTFC
jgi:hypothetical protein